MKKLFLIHTINSFMDIIYTPHFKPLLEQYPDLSIHNIMDDTLLAETRENAGITNGVCMRILNYVNSAERAGADVVMVTCTSVNEAAKHARRFSQVPVFNIDEPTVREALGIGNRIGVLATLPTSPKGTVRLIEEYAREMGKTPEIVTRVAEGAYDILVSGDRPGHDARVVEALRELALEVDCIIFAQISMSMLPLPADLGVPVLKIGEAGIREALRLLHLEE